MTATKTTSPARIAANRANSQRSTGPRTEAGKARARANACKHGLTGAGIVLPNEVAAVVEAAFVRVQEEFAPQTYLGMKLAYRMALHDVRGDRAARHEAACLRARARRAGLEFDRARANQADALLDAIEANPRPYRRALLALPEGVDRLIEALLELRGDLAGAVPAWSERHHRRLDALFGYRPDDLPWHRPTRFSRAITDDFLAIGEDEIAAIPDGESPKAWAADRQVEAIDAEVARLREHRATLDLGAIAEERADLAEGDLLEPGPEAERARRYEANAAREFSRALRDFRIVEAMIGPEPEPESDSDSTSPVDSLDDLAPPPISEAPKPPADPDLIEPNSAPDHEMSPPLASFGAAVPSATPEAPSTPAATPGVAPAAPTPPAHPIPTRHTDEPPFHFVPVGR